jgi:hypothetical protein
MRGSIDPTSHQAVWLTDWFAHNQTWFGGSYGLKRGTVTRCRNNSLLNYLAFTCALRVRNLGRAFFGHG